MIEYSATQNDGGLPSTRRAMEHELGHPGGSGVSRRSAAVPRRASVNSCPLRLRRQATWATAPHASCEGHHVVPMDAFDLSCQDRKPKQEGDRDRRNADKRHDHPHSRWTVPGIDLDQTVRTWAARLSEHSAGRLGGLRIGGGFSFRGSRGRNPEPLRVQAPRWCRFRRE